MSLLEDYSDCDRIEDLLVVIDHNGISSHVVVCAFVAFLAKRSALVASVAVAICRHSSMTLDFPGLDFVVGLDNVAMV